MAIPFGLLVFYGVCRALGVKELAMALRAFLDPLRRRLNRTL